MPQSPQQFTAALVSPTKTAAGKLAGGSILVRSDFGAHMRMLPLH
jgi:hypothetical protein